MPSALILFPIKKKKLSQFVGGPVTIGTIIVKNEYCILTLARGFLESLDLFIVVRYKLSRLDLNSNLIFQGEPQIKSRE